MTDPVDLALREAEAFAEDRNPGRGDSGWTSLDVAQLRFERSTSRWTPLHRGRSERWRRHDDVAPSARVEALLEELDADPTGIFWG